MNNRKRNQIPLLEMCGINKSFPGVHALKNISLTLQKNEVLGLVGENGAGKSTLIKILGGAHLADSGAIIINGKPAQIRTPTEAQNKGISVIYQEFNLIPDLTVRENIYLGKETGVNETLISKAKQPLKNILEMILSQNVNDSSIQLSFSHDDVHFDISVQYEGTLPHIKGKENFKADNLFEDQVYILGLSSLFKDFVPEDLSIRKQDNQCILKLRFLA